MSFLDQPWCPASVQVTVLQARGLRAKGKGGTNDAYALMQVGKDKYQTSVVEKSVAPVWKEEAAFELPQLGAGGEKATLHVHVLHRALVGPDKLLGQAVINLLQLSEDKTRNKTEWFKLLDKTGKVDKDRGEVLVNIQFLRNNMTGSMFDLSSAGKPRSRLGKLKDKVRGKKKELDQAAGPSFTQVLTDSEEEQEEDGGQSAAGTEEEKKKKPKLKSLFSHKSNLQRNMSQSMLVLPAKNSSLSGSLSSGLNVDASEGKKKFKFMKHKRSGSSDSKDPSSQKHSSIDKSNLCINGSHVYCDDPLLRTARVGSNFSLASSGHGSMEDVPESSPPSVDSLPAIRQYTTWEEEEEEEEEDLEDGNAKEETERRKMIDRFDEKEERMRLEEKEERERLQEEEQRMLKEEKLRKEEEERMRREEDEQERLAKEKRSLEEQQLQVRNEEKERKEEQERMRRQEQLVAEEMRRLQEEGKRNEEKAKEDEEKKRQKEKELERLAEEKRRMQEERKRNEERARKEEQESMRRQEQLVAEEMKRLEEEKKNEEKLRKDKEEKMIKEERARKEEQERMRRQEQLVAEERKRLEEEDRKRNEEKMRKDEEEMMMNEEKARKEEQERKRREAEEQERLAEEKKRWGEVERRRQEEKARRNKEEKMRREEELERLAEEQRRVEEERKRNEEKVRKEEEERIVKRETQLRQLAEEKRRQVEEERMKREEERAREEERMRNEEKVRKEKEERMRRQKEELERLTEERRRMEEEEKERKKEEEKMRRREELERIALEENHRVEEEGRRQSEKEERTRREEKRKQDEEEEIRRQEQELAEQKKRLEEEERRIEKARKEEQARMRQEEQLEERKKKEDERLAEEDERKKIEEASRRGEDEKVSKEVEERERMEEQEQRRTTEEEEQERKQEEGEHKGMDKKETMGEEEQKMEMMEDITYTHSTNPFDEDVSNNDITNVPSGSKGNTLDTDTTILESYQMGSKTISLDEKKRPAPQPPCRTQGERPNQGEGDGPTHHLALNAKQSKDKEVKTVSVPPQSRSLTDAKNTTSGIFSVGKHTKRPAPSIPNSEPRTFPVGLNPFEDDDDDDDAAATSHDCASVLWPPPMSQTPDLASETKVKSSKARAPAPPAKVVAAVQSTPNKQNPDHTHTTPEDDQTLSHLESLPNECAPKQPVAEDATRKKEVPPAALRRLHPVKPLTPEEQHPVSAIVGETHKSTGLVGNGQEKTKVKESGAKGPYSMLTKDELISLVVKQESQLQEKDTKIAELEKYIDNLLVRVMEEKPSILMSLKKVV